VTGSAASRVSDVEARGRRLASRVVLVLATAVLLLLVGAGGAASEGESGWIVFASYLPEYPLPADFQVARTFVVGVSGHGGRMLVPDGVRSPDGSRVAAVRLGSELLVSKIDGTQQRSVAEAPPGTGISAVTWSRGGSQLAFVAGGVWVVRADGRGLRKVFSPASPMTISSLAWSSDDSTLAFVAGGVWVVGADGTGAWPVFSPPPGTSISGVTWSPDRSHLAVFVGDEVWLASTDSGTPRRLFAPAAYANGTAYESLDGFAWSPTGAVAVTVQTSAGCINGSRDCVSWYVLTFDAGGAPLAKIPGATDLEWSPDGKRIMFETGPFLIAPEEDSIETARPDGSAVRTLTTGLEKLRGGECWSNAYWLDRATVVIEKGGACDQAQDPFGWSEVAFDVVRERDGSLLWRTRAFSETFSRNGQRVALLKPFRGTTALYTATRTGKGERRLNRAGAAADRPVFSRDDRQVMFTSTDCCSHSLDVVAVSGGPVRRIARVKFERNLINYGWSGSRIVYSTELFPSGVTALWTMRSDGTDIRRLTSYTSSDTDPSWSPDGQRVAFVRDTTGSSDDSAASIELVPAGGGRVRRVVGASGQIDSNPSWAPDGKRIAYLRNGDSISIVNADGTGAHRLKTAAALLPTELSATAWSPDGKTIAYASSLASDAIVLVRTDGSGSVTLLSSCRFCLGPPAWSPDGTRLAFDCTGCTEDETGVAVINADGSGLRLVALDRGLGSGGYPGVLSARSPAWSPDGRQLLFSGTSCTNDTNPQNGPPSICAVSTESTQLRSLTPEAVGSFAPSATASSRTVQE
jgi:Tol biopolymer transport system component